MSVSKRQILEQWLSVEEFDRLYGELSSINSSEFYRPTNQWLRDAYIAMQFSKLIGAAQVRLIPKPATQPDFEVTLSCGRLLRMEATEALPKGRRRGDEFKFEKRLGYPMRLIDQDELLGRRLAIPYALSNAIQKKRNKTYDEGTCLVVDVNIGTSGLWRDEIERDLMACLAEAAGAFERVYAIWSGRLYSRCQESRDVQNSGS